MAKRERGDGITETTRRGRRYTTGRVEEEREAPGDAQDEELTRASMEDLYEFADELEIEDYESMTREELVREIRRETRSEP